MNYKDFMKVMQSIEEERKITKEIVIEALKEALAKAYRKHIDAPDALIKVDIDEDHGDITVYQQFTVVEEPLDDELEVALEDVSKINAALQIGDLYDKEVSITELGRAAASLAKNVMKQKIREAEKQAIHDEYIDKLDEMVTGTVESVEEKFIVVNLGKTLALMPRAAQMVNETYTEGQNIKVIITEVNKDTKGAQVLVSRADAKLVRRLFENEVPEIYQGLVEIKAIAREAGERTKIAVYSKNPDVDPIGACIGPRGSRVQVVIEELKGEKIDIFEWSDDLGDLITNALAPAQIIAVVPMKEKRGLLVIVDDNQLSLAIGKKGKNARLAVRLTGSKIDIKTKASIEEEGLDYNQLLQEYYAEQEKIKRDKEIAEYMRQQQLLVEEEVQAEDTPAVEEVYEIVEETEETLPTEEVVEPVKEPKRPKKELKERSTGYVSRFEKLDETAKTPEKKDYRAKRKKTEEDERKLNSVDIRKDKDYSIKPEYSDEELTIIQQMEEEERSKSWVENEIDFDEFDEYYE